MSRQKKVLRQSSYRKVTSFRDFTRARQNGTYMHHFDSIPHAMNFDMIEMVSPMMIANISPTSEWEK